MKRSTLDEARSLASSGEYRLIPMYREILSDFITPIMCVSVMKTVSDHCFLLESAEANRTWGRYTFLGYDPKMELNCLDGEVRMTGQTGTTLTREKPGDAVRRVMKENRAPLLKDLPPFTGGLVGYFSYEFMKYSEPSLRFSAGNRHEFSDMDLMFFDKIVAFDNLRQIMTLIVNVPAYNIEESFNNGISELDKMEELLRNGKPLEEKPGRLKEPLRHVFSEEEYCDKVVKTKEYIVDGDIFQLVLSNPMEAAFEGSLLDMYRLLRTTNPSPYMFYFSGDTELAGASPETLVKVQGDTVRTFPLAGSRPRGKTETEDKELEKELLADEKELAEHNMLVDLGRNDLGRICSFGSVKVEKYMEIERYSHIMHIGSEVSGTLREDADCIDAIESVLPAGTLSGAPKIRAAEIIDELEKNRRGIYGGAVGYVDLAGNLDTCIAIRLAYKKNGRVFVRSGAGIVADSVPGKEYRECINKARAVTEALEAAEDIRL